MSGGLVELSTDPPISAHVNGYANKQYFWEKQFGYHISTKNRFHGMFLANLKRCTILTVLSESFWPHASSGALDLRYKEKNETCRL